MSWLFGNKQPNAQFGITTTSKFKDSIKIDAIGEKIKNTGEKLNKEIKKYQHVAALNKKLTDSYVANYYAMIDVSKLLKDYSEVFDKLGEMLKKYDQIEISPVDLDHLKNITRSKLDELTTDFNKQSASIKALYTKYNMGSELGKLSTVEPLTRDLGSSVDETMMKIAQIPSNSPTTTSSFGGSKNKNYIKRSSKIASNGRSQKKAGKKA